MTFMIHKVQRIIKLSCMLNINIKQDRYKPNIFLERTVILSEAAATRIP